MRCWKRAKYPMQTDRHSSVNFTKTLVSSEYLYQSEDMQFVYVKYYNIT